MATSLKSEVGGCRAGGGWWGAEGPRAERVRVRVGYFVTDIVAVSAGLMTQAQASLRNFDLHHLVRDLPHAATLQGFALYLPRFSSTPSPISNNQSGSAAPVFITAGTRGASTRHASGVVIWLRPHGTMAGEAGEAARVEADKYKMLTH